MSSTVMSPLADQTTSRIVAELWKKCEDFRLRRGLKCYHDMSKGIEESLALQTQTFSYTDTVST